MNKAKADATVLSVLGMSSLALQLPGIRALLLSAENHRYHPREAQSMVCNKGVSLHSTPRRLSGYTGVVIKVSGAKHHGLHIGQQLARHILQ